MITVRASAILLDIEGTTSSVRFVYDVLFPYARQHVLAFLRRHLDEQPVRTACESIVQESQADDLPRDLTPENVCEHVYRLMDRDAKTTGLKELQGMIWRDGFESGELKAHVYDDVVPALEGWRKAGKKICIYSSGSIAAQKLFFGHTIQGDLLEFFSGHFDTTTGPKKVATSYAAIAEAMKTPPGQIVFVSDVPAELDAARAAGLQTVLSLRPENPPVENPAGHPSIRSFSELMIA